MHLMDAQNVLHSVMILKASSSFLFKLNYKSPAISLSKHLKCEIEREEDIKAQLSSTNYPPFDKEVCHSQKVGGVPLA